MINSLFRIKKLNESSRTTPTGIVREYDEKGKFVRRVKMANFPLLRSGWTFRVYDDNSYVHKHRPSTHIALHNYELAYWHDTEGLCFLQPDESDGSSCTIRTRDKNYLKIAEGEITLLLYHKRMPVFNHDGELLSPSGKFTRIPHLLGRGWLNVVTKRIDTEHKKLISVMQQPSEHAGHEKSNVPPDSKTSRHLKAGSDPSQAWLIERPKATAKKFSEPVSPSIVASEIDSDCSSSYSKTGHVEKADAAKFHTLQQMPPKHI